MTRKCFSTAAFIYLYLITILIIDNALVGSAAVKQVGINALERITLPDWLEVAAQHYDNPVVPPGAPTGPSKVPLPAKFYLSALSSTDYTGHMRRDVVLHKNNIYVSSRLIRDNTITIDAYADDGFSVRTTQSEDNLTLHDCYCSTGEGKNCYLRPTVDRSLDNKLVVELEKRFEYPDPANTGVGYCQSHELFTVKLGSHEVLLDLTLGDEPNKREPVGETIPMNIITLEEGDEKRQESQFNIKVNHRSPLIIVAVDRLPTNLNGPDDPIDLLVLMRVKRDSSLTFATVVQFKIVLKDKIFIINQASNGISPVNHFAYNHKRSSMEESPVKDLCFGFRPSAGHYAATDFNLHIAEGPYRIVHKLASADHPASGQLVSGTVLPIRMEEPKWIYYSADQGDPNTGLRMIDASAWIHSIQRMIYFSGQDVVISQSGPLEENQDGVQRTTLKELFDHDDLSFVEAVWYQQATNWLYVFHGGHISIYVLHIDQTTDKVTAENVKSRYGKLFKDFIPFFKSSPLDAVISFYEINYAKGEDGGPKRAPEWRSFFFKNGYFFSLRNDNGNTTSETNSTNAVKDDILASDQNYEVHFALDPHDGFFKLGDVCGKRYIIPNFNLDAHYREVKELYSHWHPNKAEFIKEDPAGVSTSDAAKVIIIILMVVCIVLLVVGIGIWIRNKHWNKMEGSSGPSPPTRRATV